MCVSLKCLIFFFAVWTFVLTFFFGKKKPKLRILISSSMTLFLMLWKYFFTDWSSFFFFINNVSICISEVELFRCSLIVQDNFNKLNVCFGKLLDDLFTDWTLVLTFFFGKKKPKFIKIYSYSLSICLRLSWTFLL